MNNISLASTNLLQGNRIELKKCLRKISQKSCVFYV